MLPPTPEQLAGESPERRAAARTTGVVMLITAAVLWSLSGVAVKLAGLPAIGFTFWRSLGAGVFLLAISRFFGGTKPPVRWMGFSVGLYAVVVTLFIIATRLDTSASAILLQYTGPIFCALFAWLFQGRRIGRLTLIALTIASLGIVVMIAGAERSRSLVGPACGLGSGVAFGGLILVLEKLERLGGGRLNSVHVVMFNNLGCAGIMLPIGLAAGQLAVTPAQLAMVAAAGAVQMAVPYLLFQYALRRVQPVDASLLILLEPVLNPVWVWLAVGERPDAATFVGGACVLTAMVIEAAKLRLYPARTAPDPTFAEPARSR